MGQIIDAAPSDGPILRNASGDPWTTSYLSQTIKRYARKAKLDERLHLHDARGTACTRLLMAGATLGEIEAAVIDQLRAVFRQPEIVAGTLRAARAHEEEITEADARAALQQLDPLWDELFPAEQARIVALLVERVDIGTEGLNVRLRVDGLGGLAREMLAGDMGAAA